MQTNEYDNISINGQFDLLFKEKCPTHPKINWKLLKSLAFNESELQPYVLGGIFRAPERLYYEFDGKDPLDPSDAIKTISSILQEWWKELSYLSEKNRILFVVLAYKLRFYDIKYLTNISREFDDLYNYFSPGLLLEVKKIVYYAEIM